MIVPRISLHIRREAAWIWGNPEPFWRPPLVFPMSSSSSSSSSKKSSSVRDSTSVSSSASNPLRTRRSTFFKPPWFRMTSSSLPICTNTRRIMDRLKIGQRPRRMSTCTINILLPPHWCQTGYLIVIGFFFSFLAIALVTLHDPGRGSVASVSHLVSSFIIQWQPPVDSGPDAVPLPELNTIVFYRGNKLSTPPCSKRKAATWTSRCRTFLAAVSHWEPGNPWILFRSQFIQMKQANHQIEIDQLQCWWKCACVPKFRVNRNPFFLV